MTFTYTINTCTKTVGDVTYRAHMSLSPSPFQLGRGVNSRNVRREPATAIDCRSSGVGARFGMTAVVGRAGAGGGLRRGLRRFWFVFGYDDGHAVDGHLAGLRGAAVDVFQPGRVASLRQGPLLLLVLLGVARRGHVLLRHLLGDQLWVDSRLPSRRPLAYVTHQAFERLGRVPKRAHTTIPEIILEHLRLPFRPSDRTLFVVHFLR